jgi:hypothetical protein
MTVIRNAAMPLIRMLAAAAFFASSCMAQSGQNPGAIASARPTVVEVEKTQRGVAYKVDGQRADLTATTNLLYLLNRVCEKRGPNAPIVVLLDPRVPIDQIGNVDGTAGKAQLNNLRYFVLDRDTQKMSEIKWGPAVPYSTNPPINRDPPGIR